MAVSDRVGGAGFYAVTAKNTAGIVDVVNLRIPLACRNTVGCGVFRGFDVDAIRRTGCGAEKTAYALFVTVLVALENMDAAIAWLYGGRRVGKTFGSSFAEHGA